MRLVRCTLAATAAVLVAGVVVGCSSPQGKPTPATSDPATPTSAGPTSNGLTAHGAPKVSHPVDVTAFEQNPCTMLTATQVQQLGITAPSRVDNTPEAWGCVWDDTDGPTGANLHVSLLKGGGGLDAIYANRTTQGLFQPIATINGYPAVLADPIDERTSGGCIVDVGVRDDVALDVYAIMRGGTNPAHDYSNPCGVAQAVTKGVVATMTGGA